MEKEFLLRTYLDALQKTEDAIRAVKLLKAANGRREFAIAQTEIETAQLWLMAAEVSVEKVDA